MKKYLRYNQKTTTTLGKPQKKMETETVEYHQQEQEVTQGTQNPPAAPAVRITPTMTITYATESPGENGNARNDS